MVRHEFSTGMARAARAPWRIAALLLAGLAATDAARAADQVASKPLDLSLPRQAGQWTGVASRERQDPRPEIGGGAPQPRALAVQARPRPYGTGYEARMSSGVAAAAPGAVGAGPQGAAASPAAPRGGGGKGR